MKTGYAIAIMSRLGVPVFYTGKQDAEACISPHIQKASIYDVRLVAEDLVRQAKEVEPLMPWEVVEVRYE